jgi:hypothetical protein
MLLLELGSESCKRCKSEASALFEDNKATVFDTEKQKKKQLQKLKQKQKHMQTETKTET